MAFMVACGGKAEVYVTSGVGEVQPRFAQYESELGSVSAQSDSYIKLLPTKTLQPIYGFGAAITGSTCYNLLQMSAEDRERT